MTHAIRQQILEVEWNGPESAAMRFQHRLSDWTYSLLMPALSRVLDACVPADVHLRVEHLVLNVGEVTIENFDNELPELIAEALTKAIREKWTEIQGSLNPGGNIRNSHQLTAEAFAYFLQTGLLPWAYRVPANLSWEEVVRQAMVKEPRTFERIVSKCFAEEVVRRRLTAQFSASFLLDLFYLSAPQKAFEVAEMLKILNEIAADKSLTAAVNPIVKQLWQLIWQQIGTGQTVDLSQVVKAVLKNNPVAIQLILKATLRRWSRKSHPAEATRLPIQTESATKIKPESVGLLLPDEIYIENAGLVLLHPFLPQYFEGILCAVDDQLIWPEKAALALHYLVKGQAKAAEYELTVAKLLCNIPLSQPLPITASWTEHDTEESEALLMTVIKYWSALQNSSIGLLRAEFLQRAGKLSRREGGWQLQVERKDFDILLEQLPWGFSTFKLPWMEDVLSVEWI